MITVLGSINIDLTFKLARLPQPGETMLTPSCTEAVGGKGANQAVAAARDGGAVRFVGCVGNDAFGERARQALAGDGVDIAGLATATAPTGLASIWVDGDGRNMIAVASGANGHARAAALEPQVLGPGEIVVLQMEVPPVEVEAAIARARTAGATLIMNLAPALPLSRQALSCIDILVVNEHEAAALCAEHGPAGGADASAPEAQLRALADMVRGSVIITLGEAGAIAADDRALWRIGALPVAAVDTTGAGDCFVGVLAAGLARGLPLPDAMRRGVVAASLACTVIGAQPSFPTSDRLEAALKSPAAPSAISSPL